MEERNPQVQTWTDEHGRKITKRLYGFDLTGRFSSRLGRDPKLHKLFADAERWVEEERDEDDCLVAWRIVAFHPRYPSCKGMMEYTVTGQHPNTKGAYYTAFRRVIEDDGHSSLAAIREMAKYTQFMARDALQERRGGPQPGIKPETHERYMALAEGYERVGYRSVTGYASDREKSPSTVYRAIRYRKAILEGRMLPPG